MMKVLGSIVLAVTLAVGSVVAWLVWPAPSLEYDYGPLVHSAYEAGECVKVGGVAGVLYAQDRNAAAELFQPILDDGDCPNLAIELDEENIEFWNLVEVLNERGRRPTYPWTAYVRDSYELWRDAAADRHRDGVPAAYWTDAVTYFRCGGELATPYAHMRLQAPETIRIWFPDLEVPFERRRQRCEIHIRDELERLNALGMENRPGTDVGGLVLRYEVALISFERI